jgi:hypothetical protein
LATNNINILKKFRYRCVIGIFKEITMILCNELVQIAMGSVLFTNQYVL